MTAREFNHLPVCLKSYLNPTFKCKSAKNGLALFNQCTVCKAFKRYSDKTGKEIYRDMDIDDVINMFK